jgi:hypothetical protein
MFLFAHHMAVELLGREFSPRTPLEHVCVFAAVGFVLGTSAYGTWTLIQKARGSARARRQV